MVTPFLTDRQVIKLYSDNSPFNLQITIVDDMNQGLSIPVVDFFVILCWLLRPYHLLCHCQGNESSLCLFILSTAPARASRRSAAWRLTERRAWSFRRPISFVAGCIYSHTIGLQVMQLIGFVNRPEQLHCLPEPLHFYKLPKLTGVTCHRDIDHQYFPSHPWCYHSRYCFVDIVTFPVSRLKQFTDLSLPLEPSGVVMTGACEGFPPV